MNKFALWIAVFTFMVGGGSSRSLAQEPVVITVYDRIVIPADTSWNSPVRFGEMCTFDLEVRYEEVFTITNFGDHEVWHIQINDKYTNLVTGFTFKDPADYHIRFDYNTGFAFHAGVFWRVVNTQDRSIGVLDEGSFEQNWFLPFPQQPVQLTGPDHDVATLPFGTLSYCDWAQGIFSRSDQEAAPLARERMIAPTSVPSARWGLRLEHVASLASRRPFPPMQD